MNEQELGQDLASDQDDNAGAPTQDQQTVESTEVTQPDEAAPTEETPVTSPAASDNGEMSAPPPVVVIQDDGTVNHQLEHTTDGPRKPFAEPLGIGKAKELIKTGTPLDQHFDPQVGMKSVAGENAKAVVPVKVTTVVPDMEGGAAKGTQKVENGKLVWKIKAALKNCPITFNEEAVTKAFSGLLADALSKYMLENFTKGRSKLVENTYYGRKMPLYANTSGMRLSLAVVEELSGQSFEDFLHDLLRSGWYKKSTAIQKFELAQMCETTDEVEAVLKSAGATITEWKPKQFHGYMGTVNVFKRIGKIVSDNFQYKGVAPQSAAILSVVDCIEQYNSTYEEFYEQISLREEQEANGDIPPGSVTEQARKNKAACETHLGRWNIVVCGLQGLANTLAKVEQEKLAAANRAAKKASAAEDVAEIDPFEDELEFMKF